MMFLFIEKLTQKSHVTTVESKCSWLFGLVYFIWSILLLTPGYATQDVFFHLFPMTTFSGPQNILVTESSIC